MGHATAHIIDNGIDPTFAVRRISDGAFLCDDGGFHRLEDYYSRVDIRTAPDHWRKYGKNITGCEVVSLARVTVVTIVPIPASIYEL
jgi:hypothetical protein